MLKNNLSNEYFTKEYIKNQKILNSTKENSNSYSLDPGGIPKAHKDSLISIKNPNLEKEKHQIFYLSKNLILNEINCNDRRSIRKEGNFFANGIPKHENKDSLSLMVNNRIEADILDDGGKDFLNIDLDKKIKQHAVQQAIDNRYKLNPNDKKLFENILHNQPRNNNLFYNPQKSNNNFIKNQNILKPDSLKRLISLSPYATVPNHVKFSWANNPSLYNFYQPTLPRSLMDSQGNRFKHVSHGSSTIYFKDSVQENDILKNLLDINVELGFAFKKSIKIKNIRKIIKLKTSI